MKIVIEILLCIAGLFLMWFLGIMIYAFCFMIHSKTEDFAESEDNNDTD